MKAEKNYKMKHKIKKYQRISTKDTQIGLMINSQCKSKWF